MSLKSTFDVNPKWITKSCKLQSRSDSVTGLKQAF